MSDAPEKSDAELAEMKAKEAAEQAALPYKWTQTIKDVDVTIPISSSIKGRDLDVVLTKTKLKIAIKGQLPIIDVRTLCRMFLHDHLEARLILTESLG